MSTSDIKAREEIIRLMREDFDPTPPGWEGRDWNDNAEDVADKIIAAALSEKPASVADAWRIVKRWLDRFAEEETAFSRYQDAALIDGVMSAGEMRALNANLARLTAPVSEEELVERAATAIYDAPNGIDGDPIGTMIHENFRIAPKDGDLGIPATKAVCREAARAVLSAVSGPIREQGRRAGLEEARAIILSTISDGETVPYYAPELDGGHPADAYGNMRAQSIAEKIGRALKDSPAPQPASSAKEWQPIEAAPEDGRRVLLHVQGGATFVGFYSTLWGAWHSVPSEYRCSPSYWMPLPPPPAVAPEPPLSEGGEE